MDAYYTDWIAILIAALLNMVIGFGWYSKWLFGPTWLKLSQMKEKDVKPGGARFLGGFAVSLVIAYFLSFFQLQLGITNVADAMYLGAVLWLAFVATTQIGAVLWCKQPFQLFAIHTGCKLLSFLVMSGILGA